MEDITVMVGGLTANKRLVVTRGRGEDVARAYILRNFGNVEIVTVRLPGYRVAFYWRAGPPMRPTRQDTPRAIRLSK